MSSEINELRHQTALSEFTTAQRHKNSREHSVICIMALHRERACVLCGHQEGFAGDVLGGLIGPVGEDARSKAPLWVHRECAIWSPEAYETGDGHIRGISRVLKRGRVTWCAECQKRGATMGCRLDACQHSYHKYCAAQAGCTFYPGQYLIACKAHAHLYTTEALPGGQTPLTPYSPYQGGRALALGEEGEGVACALGMKRLRQTPPDERLRNAKRAVKRLRHEARAAYVAGSDDEEHFQNKDRARLARDKLRLNPVVLGGKRKSAAAEAPAAAIPMPAPTDSNNNVVPEGWAAVGGHGAVIQQLKEMVLLPLHYPEVFTHMAITPPRGILFHGSPGTGKTLVARALAGACSHSSGTPVTFYGRKGADCLGKFAGEAERTLRLLFDEAARTAPSIIFLDELDGLVPARASNSSSSDQVFASVVATLLALMDGVTDRGAVVVIGATNRPEAIDPALRRPGRFDREVHFGLPSAQDRAAILKVHTTRLQTDPVTALLLRSVASAHSRWQTAPGNALLQRIAASTEGFAGADLQALCTAAVMAAVTQSCPNLVDQLCHTAPAGLGPHPVSQSRREPSHQQQQQTDKQQQQLQQQSDTQPQPDKQQQQHLTQQQQQLGEQQQQQQRQVHVAGCSPDAENPTALGGVGSHSTAQSAQEQQQPNQQQQQPDQEQRQVHAKQQAKQQGPLQQQQEQHHDPQHQQQQQRDTGDQDAQQQHSDRQQQNGQQQHQQPQDGSTGADRLHNGHQVTQATQQNKHHTADESSDHKSQKKVLTKLRVKAVDWRAALAAAPLPCSARQSLSALSSGHARALPHHLAPLLLPCITRALQCVAAAQLPWQDATAAALEACVAAASTAAAAAADEAEADAVGRGRLERLLAELGAIEGPGSANAGTQSQNPPQAPVSGPPHPPQSPRPCNLLLCGEEDAGQGLVVGALLKVVQGVQVHTISLPVLVLGGSGDTSAGLVQLLGEALRRASGHLPLLLYLPSIEAWALDTVTVSSEEVQEGQAAGAGQAGSGPTPSRNAQPSITPLKSYPASISPFRGLVSLQARQSGSGGSRGNPPTGIPSACKATPAPARHLSFPHSSPDSQPQPFYSAMAAGLSTQPGSDGPASPTLSLPTLRPPQAVPPSPQFDLTAPSSHATAAPSSPEVTQAALASPALTLPSPGAFKAAASSPASEVQSEQKVSSASVEGDAATAATAGLSDCEAMGQEQHEEVEVCVPSEIWKVFQQAVKQIPATQPLLILATCQKPPEELPPALLNFFQPHSPAATSASCHPSQQSDDHMLSNGNNSLTATSTNHAGTLGSSQVIVVGSEAEAASAGSWQEAVSRSAEAAADAVAAVAAIKLQQKLVGVSRAASSQQVSHGNPCGAQNPIRSQTRLGQSLHGPDAEAGGADRKAMCEKAVNQNQLHQGLQLHAEVQRRIRLCGQRLLTDRRIKCTQAPVRASVVDPNLSVATPSSPTHLTSLAAVAQHAQQGHFHSLQAFAEAAGRAVVGSCLAVQDRVARRIRQGKAASTGYSVRAAAACALGDDVALWCHTIAQQLCLTDPANQRVIAAAQRHIASKQQQQQQAAASTRKASQASAGAQHRCTNRAQLDGLLSSSDDSEDLGKQMATAQMLEQPDNTGGEGAGVRKLGRGEGAGRSAHAGQPTEEAPAGGRPGDTSGEAQIAADGAMSVDDGAVGVDGAAAMAEDISAVGTGTLSAGGVEHCGGDSDGDAVHAALEQEIEEVAGGQVGGTDRAGQGSCQAAPSSQAAGYEYDHQLLMGQQPGMSQQPGFPQLDSRSPAPRKSQQQGPKVVRLQGRLGLQQCCQKMQVTLQAALFPIFMGAFGKCAHSLQALLQCHDALTTAALQCLPANADTLAEDVQTASATEATVVQTCLLQSQAELVKEMQVFVTIRAQSAR